MGLQEILNPHYNFNDPANLNAIQLIRAYDLAFENADLDFLAQAEQDVLKGQNGYAIGVNVSSPWGENIVLEAQIGEFDAHSDVIKKDITVKSGYMLSLQRHRGRKERWEVIEGTLTVISDGALHTVKTGESINLPKGNVHCMINKDDTPVRVIETQSGICREADNVRLIDFNNRPTIPLANQNEALSAILYAQIHQEIKNKFGCETTASAMLLDPKYAQTIARLNSAA